MNYYKRLDEMDLDELVHEAHEACKEYRDKVPDKVARMRLVGIASWLQLRCPDLKDKLMELACK